MLASVNGLRQWPRACLCVWWHGQARRRGWDLLRLLAVRCCARGTVRCCVRGRLDGRVLLCAAAHVGLCAAACAGGWTGACCCALLRARVAGRARAADGRTDGETLGTVECPHAGRCSGRGDAGAARSHHPCDSPLVGACMHTHEGYRRVSLARECR